MHAALAGNLVAQREVLRAAVVPNGHGTRRPFKSACEFWARRVCHQKINQWLGFDVVESFKRLRMVADIQRLFTGFRMGSDQWMCRFSDLIAWVF